MATVVKVVLFTFVIFSLCGRYASLLPTETMSTKCGQELAVRSPMLIRLTREDNNYQSDMTCSLNLFAPYGHRLLIDIMWLDIHVHNITCHDHMTIRDYENPLSPVLVGPLCHRHDLPYGSLTSQQASASVLFSSDSSGEGRGFELLVTPFHTGHCYEDEYSCKRGRCVDLDDDLLQCNKTYNYCGDDSDYCRKDNLPAWYKNLLPIVVSLALVSAIVIAVFLLAKEKMGKQNRVSSQRRSNHHDEPGRQLPTSVDQVPGPPEYSPPYSAISPPPSYDSIYPNKTLANPTDLPEVR